MVYTRERRLPLARIRFHAVEPVLRQELEERSGTHGRQGRNGRSALRHRARGRCVIQPRYPVERREDAELDEDGQVDFKGNAKAFARTYAFIASILPYTNA